MMKRIKINLCDTKAEKYSGPTLYESFNFTYECKIDELASVEDDLGYWEFFIE
ncbi:hypothetical protein ACR6EC_05850 [Bacillus subtilis]